MSNCRSWRRRLHTAAWALLGLHLGGWAAGQAAEEALYPAPAPAEIDWRRILTQRLPPLTHARGDRWPLVVWQGVGFEPLERDEIEAMLDRGFVQHLRLSRADVEAARRLAAAGAPVVLMEGEGGAWPYDTVAEEEPWRLQFAPGTEVLPEWRELADPTRIAGWERGRALTRERLRRYKSEGVDVDAVWLDYEGALLHDDFHALRASTAAAKLPRRILTDEARYRDYRRVHWLQRLSRYLAVPVREIYPGASVTNWVVMVSTGNHPVLSWTDWPHPPSPPLYFSHSNPIAYGIDTYFQTAWPAGHPVNRDNVDRFYTHLLLRQVSVDALNRSLYRPRMGAVVWVGRLVADDPEERTPVMSRAAYREALRHIWLRGVDAMQVFNPAGRGYERYAIREVEDVQQVYDEMLEYREFLDRGEPMNFTVPDNREGSVMWSGLRLAGRAVVRVSNLGAAQSAVTICLHDGRCDELPVPERGWTFIIDAPDGLKRGRRD